MLITDRDILLLDPTAFAADGAAGVAQLLFASTDAEVSGPTLTSASADFAARGIDAGHVAVVDGEPLEIVGRTSATVLEVSRPRAADDDPAIPPDDGSELAVSVLSFATLIAQHQPALLRELGLGEAAGTGSLDETAIMNADALGVVLAQRVLRDAFSHAAARNAADASLAARAALWTRSLRAAEATAVALIDLDGDGVPDVLRHLRVPRMVRA